MYVPGVSKVYPPLYSSPGGSEFFQILYISTLWCWYVTCKKLKKSAETWVSYGQLRGISQNSIGEMQRNHTTTQCWLLRQTKAQYNHQGRYYVTPTFTHRKQQRFQLLFAVLKSRSADLWRMLEIRSLCLMICLKCWTDFKTAKSNWNRCCFRCVNVGVT